MDYLSIAIRQAAQKPGSMQYQPHPYKKWIKDRKEKWGGGRDGRK